MIYFYLRKKWTSAKLSLNRGLSLNKMSLNRDCTVFAILWRGPFISSEVLDWTLYCVELHTVLVINQIAQKKPVKKSKLSKKCPKLHSKTLNCNNFTTKQSVKMVRFIVFLSKFRTFFDVQGQRTQQFSALKSTCFLSPTGDMHARPPKRHLNSECLFKVLNFPKEPMKILTNFCPKI